MEITWTYPTGERIEADGKTAAPADLLIWITESSDLSLPSQRWYWLIRDSGYDCPISDHCGSDEEAVAAVHHWLALGEEAIRAEWAKQRLAEIDKIVAKLGKHAPQAAMRITGYARGRRDGYEAARQEVAAAFGLVPREQYDQAEDARIYAEQMVDFERDYSSTLQDLLGEACTATRALAQDGELAIVDGQGKV